MKPIKSFLLTAGGIILFVGILAGILTIARTINLHPSVVLTNPCDAPCWYGITPGQVGSWEIYNSLYELEGLNISAVTGEYDKNNELVNYYWFYERPIEDSGGSIYFENDRVTAINILTVNSLDLKELFKKIGEPESYWTEIKQGQNREYVDVLVFNPSKGYLAELVIDTEYGSDQVEIKENTQVFRVTYFSPDSFQGLLSTKLLFGFPVNPDRISFQPWKGYGAITFER